MNIELVGLAALFAAGLAGALWWMRARTRQEEADAAKEKLAGAGIVVQQQQAEAIETRLRQQFGGERVYVPSLPKQTHNRVAKAARVVARTQAGQTLALRLPPGSQQLTVLDEAGRFEQRRFSVR